MLHGLILCSVHLSSSLPAFSSSLTFSWTFVTCSSTSFVLSKCCYAYIVYISALCHYPFKPVLINVRFGVYLHRFMEMTSGHSDSVNKVLEFLAVLLEKIQCIRTVNALYLETQITLFSKWTRYWESLVESGLDTHMIYCQRIAITSVMNYVKDLVFKSFLVIFFSLSVAC